MKTKVLAAIFISLCLISLNTSCKKGCAHPFALNYDSEAYTSSANLYSNDCQLLADKIAGSWTATDVYTSSNACGAGSLTYPVIISSANQGYGMYLSSIAHIEPYGSEVVAGFNSDLKSFFINYQTVNTTSGTWYIDGEGAIDDDYQSILILYTAFQSTSCIVSGEMQLVR